MPGLGVEVVDPNGRRPLSLKDAATAQSVRLTDAGFYQIRLANGRQDLIGVNPDRRASNFDVVPADVQALWRGSGQPQQARGAAAEGAPDGKTAGQPVVVRHAPGGGGGADRVVAGQSISRCPALGTVRRFA